MISVCIISEAIDGTVLETTITTASTLVAIVTAVVAMTIAAIR